ncbi:acyltransferase domain-containing protein [Streptomyces diacarni]|uniref:Acyltransferase domain-containing protein n=1 Tax=Streptomyces diacarni TaxID=2800381 RepID=A0A367F5A8_9ACTN|nr:type I polyketide synthase [Streptomyces diacarni]RCG25471.1 acyltransferase domain-containing protein [Streptomyces diacarni]
MAGVPGSEHSEHHSAEPVAVIGLGCRFAADATSPERYWNMLREGRDGISEVPDKRWEVYRGLGSETTAALRRATRWGGYLADIEGFDAEFFGLTPREAELMDPQQRVLLEVAWEALEDAGLPPGRLAGTDAGVFVGVGSDDYGRRLLEDLPRIEAWTGIGSAMCAAANRISHALDLRGPSLAVDTACSASLVALHLACQSVLSGESPVALAAGVNLIISPGLTLTLDAAGATAPDGRCKPFDAAADGYGRGEGAGVLVLKRLSDAQRDGDRVWATVLGSAVNQDGRTSGIMAPDGDAQRHVMERACRRAGVDPLSVGYVEAHGTGTRRGDPLEASALSAVYGAGRPADGPCLIGSVKSNIGHLEAAAGVAGVVKAILALDRCEIPASLHHTTPTPAVDWENAGLEVVTAPAPWPRSTRPRRAGVSGFGYGGTIAHVVLEEAPGQAEPAGESDESAGADDSAAGTSLFPVSAASAAGLGRQADALAAWLEGAGAEVPLRDVGHTLAHRRTHLDHRAAVLAADRGTLIERLRRVAADEQGPGVVTGRVPGGQDRGPVWVLSGHGSQWPGMGRGLLAEEPAFADVIDALEPVFVKEIGFSPRQVLLDGALGTVERVQTMIFAMQVGLAAVWRARGVTPAAVVGHSVGEIAAAVVSGALTLQDGARLICRRSRLLQRVAGQGAMALIALPFEDVAERLHGRTDVVAAIASSPLSTVVSGEPGAVDALAAAWQAEDLTVRRVASDVAFHSPSMDPLLPELAAAAADLSHREPRIPMYSTSSDEVCTDPVLDGAYWAGNLRRPVRLAQAVARAARDGHRSFLEISAHPVVAHSIRETLSELDQADVFVGSTLRRDQPEAATLAAAVAAVHCHGTPVDWSSLQPEGSQAPLPTVAWQRRPLWRDARKGTGDGLEHDVDTHTLLGSPVPVGGRPLRLWRTLLDETCRPYPGSHTINGVEVIPAAVLINTLLRAGSDGAEPPVLRDLRLLLPLTDAGPREVQVSHEDGGVRLTSRMRDEEGGDRPWLTHATVLAAPATRPVPPQPSPGAESGPPLAPEDPGAVRELLSSVGVPSMAFDWSVEELLRGEGLLRARVRADRPQASPSSWAPLLDAALSVAPAGCRGPRTLRMVAGLDECHLTGMPPDGATIEVTADPARENTVDVLITDDGGHVLARLGGLRYAAMDDSASGAAAPGELAHATVWRPFEPPARGTAPAPDGDRPLDLVLVCPDPAQARLWRSRFQRAGAGPRAVAAPGELAALDPKPTEASHVLVVPGGAPGLAVPESSARAAWLLAQTAQQLGGDAEGPSPRLWCLTTGVREASGEAHLAQSPLWGLGRVLRAELPGVWGGTVDVTPGDDRAPAAVLDVLRAAPDEDVVAVTAGTTEVARLAPLERAGGDGPVRCRADSTYLVTGGLGVLGLEVAHWLAERGARRLVLAGRRTLPPRGTWDRQDDEETASRIQAVRALEALGVTVRTVAVDVADPRQAAEALAPESLGMPPIRGVVHAAGVLDNRLLHDVDEESLRSVLRPKVDGAWTLHTMFPAGTLDFFALFSSCGQLLGLPGQVTYGAANAFLDGLAAHRRAAGCEGTVSFGWTSWKGKGMAVNEVVDLELRARGTAPITPAEAFGAWDLAHGHPAPQVSVLRILPQEPGMERPAVLAELDAAVEADAPDGTAGRQDDFAGLPPGLLRERLVEEVTTQVAGEMRLSARDLDPRRSLTEQGLDSVMTIVVRRRLERRFGHALPATLLWHQPTVAAIADHVAELLAAGADPGGTGGPEEPGAPDRPDAPDEAGEPRESEGARGSEEAREADEADGTGGAVRPLRPR